MIEANESSLWDRYFIVKYILFKTLFLNVSDVA
jgi:hypothetical protein